MKKLITLIFLFYTCVFFSQNYITYTPSNQTVSGKSGEEIIANIRLNALGNENGEINYFIVPKVFDNGYKSMNPSSGILKIGHNKDITIKFKKDVTTSSVIQYKFRATYQTHRGTFDKDLIINVSYNKSSSGPCTLDYPSNLVSHDITSSYTSIKWNAVIGSIGYQFKYFYDRPVGGQKIVTRETNKNAGNLIITPPNTKTGWRVRSKCANGSYSHKWSSVEYFTTLVECPDSYTVYVSLSGSKDEKSKNDLIAKNKIYHQGRANYKGGKSVRLIPGFSIQSGAKFRAFIEECTVNKSSLVSREALEIEKNSFFEENESPQTKIGYIFPNPNKGEVLNFRNYEKIVHLEIYSLAGFLMYSTKNVASQITIPNLRKGIFNVRLYTVDGGIINEKLIIE